jgi:GNAT superfamily N-acetyltransferase
VPLARRTAPVEATAPDSPRSSYSLGPCQIESIRETECDGERLAERFEASDATVLVAEDAAGDTPRVQGFADADTGNGLCLRWLHVDPRARGNGTGTAALARLGETAPATRLTAHVLEDAVEGGEFLGGVGLESDGHVESSIDEEEFSVVVVTEGDATDAPDEPSVPVPDAVTIDGEDHPIDRAERIPGRSVRSSRSTGPTTATTPTDTSARTAPAPTRRKTVNGSGTTPANTSRSGADRQSGISAAILRCHGEASPAPSVGVTRTSAPDRRRSTGPMPSSGRRRRGDACGRPHGTDSTPRVRRTDRGGELPPRGCATPPPLS